MSVMWQGFESLSLRHTLKSPVDSGLGAFCISGFYVTILRKIPVATDLSARL